MNSELIELFKEHIYFPEDNTSLCWTESDGSVSYNKDNNVHDLMQGDDETYSRDVKEGPIEVGGKVLYLLDSGCGWDYQAIFSLDSKVDGTEYWEPCEIEE